MVKKSDRITAPRLWLIVAKSFRALSLVAERSIANTGLCLTDFAALEALLHKGPLTITQIQDKVHLTAEGKRLAASSFERHAKDLEALMSPLSEKEMEQLYGSLKKLGLLAAEKLEEQHLRLSSNGRAG